MAFHRQEHALKEQQLALNIQAAHAGRNGSFNIAIMSILATSNILMDLSSAMLTSKEPSWLRARSAQHKVFLCSNSQHKQHVMLKSAHYPARNDVLPQSISVWTG